MNILRDSMESPAIVTIRRGARVATPSPARMPTAGKVEMAMALAQVAVVAMDLERVQAEMAAMAARTEMGVMVE
ncbi:MAG: hypothetical protein ACK501_13195 [Planctomycetota bacterium]